MAYFEVKNIDWVYEKFDDEGDDGEYVPEEHYCVRIEQNVRSLWANNKTIKHFHVDDIISVVINKIQLPYSRFGVIVEENKKLTIHCFCNNCKKLIFIKYLANGINNFSSVHILKHLKNLCEQDTFDVVRNQ